MRPIPRSRHILAVVIFAAVAAAAGYTAMHDEYMGPSQHYIGAMALKSHDSSLYACDPVFGGSNLWRIHTPVLPGILDMVLYPAGYEDPTLAIRILCGVVLMLYLCGMYALLHRQCRSWSVSAFVAVLSTAVIYTFGRSTWGIGALSVMSTWTLCLAFVPLIILAYLQYENQWRLLLVFGGIGLLGNINLLMAMNLSTMLIIVYLVRQKLRPKAWLMALGCILATVIMSLMYAQYCLRLRGDQPAASMDVVRKAFQVAEISILYPEVLSTLTNWFLLSAVLVVPTALVLSRVERFRVRDLSAWMVMAAAGMLIGMGSHAISQVVGSIRGTPPPIIDFFSATSLVMLPLYVLFAQALTNLFRLVRTHGHWVRWACVIVMAAWIIPSDNFRLPRHKAMDMATSFMDAEDKPHSVIKHQDRAASRKEMRLLTEWLNLNSHKNAVIISDRSEVRMLSRRSMAACKDDIWYFYHLAPGRLEEWTARVQRQRELLRPAAARVDLTALGQFADDLAATSEFNRAEQWYVITRASDAPETPVGANEILSECWGKYYRLYRLR